MTTTNPMSMKSAALAAAIAAALLSAGCATSSSTSSIAKGIDNTRNPSAQVDEDVKFPDVDDAWLKNGAFIDVEQLRRIGKGLNKNQVRELISYPHFSEGFFDVDQWDYLFNFRTGRGDEYVTCQYKVVYKDGLSDSMYWKEPSCAGFLAPRVASPAPVAAAVVAPQRLRLNTDALFAFDKSGKDDVLPNGRQELERFAAALKRDYKRLDKVVVIGHTDRLGSDHYNQALSVARAATVRDVLIVHGVPAGAIQAHGVGKSQPVVQCDDALPRPELVACLQPNRRVELEVSGER